MAKRLNIAPTKSSLLKLKEQLSGMQDGYDLLERKREILTHLVHEKLKQYQQLRQQTRSSLVTAYQWLGNAQMRVGSIQLKQIALRLKPALDIKILHRSNLGIQYPAIELKANDLEPISLISADASMDETRIKLQQATILLAQLGEAELLLLRMLEEQRKTQKRVNALKYNVIPQYQETIHYIQSNLEEEERNSLFQIKILNQK
ncbi:MAG: V-type ATP synthase subunit D [Gammaproteobacteria bacterium]|nr:V-type ATP synthase subunit D [Gammaproteobacteria bacterium]